MRDWRARTGREERFFLEKVSSCISYICSLSLLALELKPGTGAGNWTFDIRHILLFLLLY